MNGSAGNIPGFTSCARLFIEDIGGFDPGSFDCIYSVSVLEHLPILELTGVFKGIERLLKPGGCSIHTLDYVVRGAGSEWHKAHAARVLALSGFSEDEFEALTSRLASDPETYYLSAEGHNAWRGSKAYSEFPMRPVVSLQIKTGRPAVRQPAAQAETG